MVPSGPGATIRWSWPRETSARPWSERWENLPELMSRPVPFVLDEKEARE